MNKAIRHHYSNDQALERLRRERAKTARKERREPKREAPLWLIAFFTSSVLANLLLLVFFYIVFSFCSDWFWYGFNLAGNL